MNRNYSQLQQLLAGYFNQDWVDDYDSADDVIFSFISESSTEALKGTHQELKTLLLADKPEQELQAFLFDDIGCGYYYLHEWESGELWLKHVDSILGKITE